MTDTACIAKTHFLRGKDMDFVFSFDWKHLLTPTVPPLELIVRGSVMYLSIFSMLRIILRRQAARPDGAKASN